MVASSTPNALSDLEWSIHYRPSPEPTVSSWRIGRRRTATTSTKPWGTTSDERKCGRRLLAEGERHFPGSDVMKPDGWTSWNSCTTHGSSITSKSRRRMTDSLTLTSERSVSRPWSRLFGQSFKRRTKSASNSYASFSILRSSNPIITSRMSWESVMTSMISLRNVVKSSWHLLLCVHLEDFQPVDQIFALTIARFVTRSQRRSQTMYGSAIMLPSSRMWSASSKKVYDLEDTEEDGHKFSSTPLCHGTSDTGRS